MRRWVGWLGWIAVGSMGVVAIAAALESLAEQRDAASLVAPGDRVDIGGRSLHVVCEGAGSPTVVLEAGGTHTWLEYARVQPTLARQTRVCAYDRAGMGFSDPGPAPRSAGALAAELDAMLAEEDLPPPYVLVAGSAGGLVIELYARLHPDDVDGLVFLDALDSGALEALPGYGAAMERDACLASVLSRLGVLRWLDPLDVGELPPAERDLAFPLTYRPATWDAVCGLVRARAISAAELRAAPPLRADVPLAVLARSVPSGAAGVPDDLWRASQQRLAARSTRGELVVAEGSGHHVPLDRADLVIDVVGRIADQAGHTPRPRAEEAPMTPIAALLARQAPADEPAVAVEQGFLALWSVPATPLSVTVADPERAEVVVLDPLQVAVRGVAAGRTTAIVGYAGRQADTLTIDVSGPAQDRDPGEPVTLGLGEREAIVQPCAPTRVVVGDPGVVSAEIGSDKRVELTAIAAGATNVAVVCGPSRAPVLVEVVVAAEP